MSQYTTDEVLDMMERWYDKHKGDSDFDPRAPFKGFDGLLSTFLDGIDLSKDTIQQKAQGRAQKYSPPSYPPWATLWGGINLAGAVISQEGKRTHLRDARLQGADLAEAQLQGAILRGAQLQGATLMGAQLQGATLRGAQLQNAVLFEAQLKGAYLAEAKLQGAFLYGAEFKEASLEDVAWYGDHRLGEETQVGHFKMAEAVYRQLKQYYNGTGQYDHAGEFHLREMVMRRKRLWEDGGLRKMKKSSKESADSQGLLKRVKPKAIVGSLSLLLFQLSSGYGERPSWVLGWSLLAWIGFALGYFFADFRGRGLSFLGFREALYYSALPFASITPGLSMDVPDWAEGVGLIAGLLAYFLLALFLVTFVQKMARSR
jgi:uncharacterized protein YjbI with pentapeptide repeats